MKIAFASCLSATAFPHSQPVWAHIGALKPDVLLLLGDSVYIDVPNTYPDSDHAFATHLHGLYQRQLAVPEFKALINQPQLKTCAIWDDHDFLWNDANAKDARSPLHLGKALYSSNLFQCWRQALSGEPFPTSVSDERVQRHYNPPLTASQYDQWMPGYQGVTLQGGALVLHLTDGRSWRTGTQLLGATQRQQMQAKFEAFPQAIHLVASGSTFGRSGRSGWQDAVDDARWLRQMAETYRVLMLSGDIHHNAWPGPLLPKTLGGRAFWEATSSGAAVNFNPFASHQAPNDPLGMYSQKFGWLEVMEDRSVEVTLWDHRERTNGSPFTIPPDFKA